MKTDLQTMFYNKVLYEVDRGIISTWEMMEVFVNEVSVPFSGQEGRGHPSQENSKYKEKTRRLENV